MRKIVTDIGSVRGKLNRYFSECVGAGRAAEVMRHRAYQQLLTLQSDCHFKYMRFHGLFHDEMAIAYRDKNGALRFNFQYLDALFDDMLAAGIRPLVELGLMPEALASKDAHVFWWKMNTSMPKEMSEWYDLVFATVQHCSKRYGEEEVKKWYFEVWNEPNLRGFFTESENKDAYFALYEQAARAVKAVCPDFRVGGPATAGPKWIDELIDYCKKNDAPLDFISTHQYCVKHGAFDEDGRSMTQMMPVDYLTDILKEVGQKCHDAGLPCIITEWSASYSSRDPVHDTYYSAPFILEAVKRCEGYVDMMSYWVYTDIFEEVCPPRQLFHGGFGLFTVSSVKKPAYHAFRFLGSLADTELNCNDASSYACCDSEKAQILFWNNVHLDVGESLNLEYFKHPLPTKKIDDAEVVFSGLKANREYTVTVETVGYRKGDCYNAFLDGGYPEDMTREQTAELMARSMPEKLEIKAMADAEGKISLTLPQTENQADLVTVMLK